MQSNFRLEKWYMDVVTENGEVAIGYFAQLTWKNFSLTYSGFIHRDSKGKVAVKNSFAKSISPEWSEAHLKWAPSFLKGIWNPIESPIQVDLLRNENQYIEWNCVVPKGDGKVAIGDSFVDGLGYAEKMTLNILPWQLPIKELFWGRFLSSDYSIVWIEWRGPQPNTWIWVNSKLLNTGLISNEKIQANSMSLSFESKFELRSGRIGDTIFKGLRKIMSIFPAAIFQLNEKKWCGVGNLTLADGQQVNGTYIHEHVIWQ